MRYLAFGGLTIAALLLAVPSTASAQTFYYGYTQPWQYGTGYQGGWGRGTAMGYRPGSGWGTAPRGWDARWGQGAYYGYRPGVGWGATPRGWDTRWGQGYYGHRPGVGWGTMPGQAFRGGAAYRGRVIWR